MRWIAALTLLAACSFHTSLEPGDAATHAIDPDATASVTVDAAPAIDAATCTTDGLICLSGAHVTTCNGGCWLTCEDQANELDAAGRCAGWGGKLAPLRSAADEQCGGLVAQASWTGYTQAIVLGGAEDANWSWNGDAQASPYVHWADGQPNDGDGHEDAAENCAYRSTTGNWQDTSCLATFEFSCRR